MIRNGPFALLFNILVVAFVLAPLVIVCLVAFTPENVLSVPTTEFSLRWFKVIFKNSEFIVAFKNSILLAVYSASLSVLLALPAAFVIARRSFFGRQFLNALFLSPLMIPSLVLGVALLRFFVLVNIQGSFLWLTLSHAMIVTPYVIRLILGSLQGFDYAVEQAAESLGATKKVILRRITLPLIIPGIVGGWILAFINSFDELNMSIFITAPSTVTLPVKMYMYATENIDPMMSALSALIIALTAVTMLILDRVYGLDRVLVGSQD